MSAVFSPDGVHRYRLDRNVQREGIVVALFGINPSFAGVKINDQTIKKDIGFGLHLGWRKIIKGNVFAHVTTNVKGLATAVDPWGEDNHRHVESIIAEADVLVPCWGDRRKVPDRLHASIDRFEQRLFGYVGKPVMCFGLTKGGDPRHTLMLSYKTPLVPFRKALWGWEPDEVIW